MFKITFAAFALTAAVFAARPVQAQVETNTQTPPSPNSSSSVPQPVTSLPPGAGNDTINNAGSSLSTTTVTPSAPAPVAR
jgi:hypothetical protein